MIANVTNLLYKPKILKMTFYNSKKTKLRKYYQTHHIPFFSKFSNFYEKNIFFRPQFEMPRNYFKRVLLL